MNVWEFEKKINEYMQTRTPLNVVAVYEKLKDRFPLTLTHAFALENGESDYDGDYTMVCGLDVGECYNLPSGHGRPPTNLTPEREAAIRDAFKYYGLI